MMQEDVSTGPAPERPEVVGWVLGCRQAPRAKYAWSEQWRAPQQVWEHDQWGREGGKEAKAVETQQGLCHVAWTDLRRGEDTGPRDQGLFPLTSLNLALLDFKN